MRELGYTVDPDLLGRGAEVEGVRIPGYDICVGAFAGGTYAVDEACCSCWSSMDRISYSALDK